MKILNNFVPQDYQDKLEELLLGSNIAWNYNSQTAYTDQQDGPHANDFVLTPQCKETWQLVHASSGPRGLTFSPTYKLFLPVLGMAGFEKTNIYRVKANCMFKQPDYPDGCHNTPHIDNEEPNWKTLLYYVNDSDGDTLIFDKKFQKDVKHTELTIKYRSTPKKGTAILFDSDQFHCSTPPRTTERRTVINFIFGV
jgi:hypothetical protein